MYEHTGFTPDKVINHQFTQVFPELENTRLLECCEEALSNSLPSKLSNSFNPSPFPLYDSQHIGNEFFRLQQMVTIKPQKESGEDSPSVCQIIIHDVTNTVIKESLLKRLAKEREVEVQHRVNERNHLQRIINNTADAILSFRPGENIDQSNLAAELMFAMNKEELSQIRFEDLLAKSNKTKGMIAERISLFISQSIRNKNSGIAAFNAEITNNKQEDFPVEIRFSSIVTDDKVSIVAVMRNLTKQLSVEGVLKESENRYKTLAKIAPVGIFEVDRSGIFTYANSTWFQITGQPASCLQSLHWLELVSPEDHARITERWEQCQQSTLRESFEFKIKHVDVETWVLCQIMANANNPLEITGYVGTFTDITGQRQSQKRIEELAYFDPLTDLANRRLFKDRLNQAIASAQRNNTQFALLELDLDEFKKVNDSLGHDAGDSLLVEVAKRLSGIVRESDTIARIGGDEFSIILKPITQIEDIEIVAKKIIKSIQLPFYIGGEIHKVSTSIGAAVFPIDGKNSQLLIKNSDMAMYAAKESGKNRVVFFNNSMNEEADARRLLEKNLRNIIDQESFELYYQPQLDLNTNTIIGAEALLRWQDDANRMKSPEELIAVAESTGLIKSLGRLILTRAFSQISELIREGHVNEDFKLAVNISAKQFLNPSLPFDIWDLMNKNQIHGHNIELEITESVWLKDYEIANQIIECLNSFNLSVSVDDFGTGFSSLSYLYKLPINKLKIDRSFISDLSQDTRAEDIISTITAVATKLSLDVIAEGIEDESQINTLLALNCHLGQGYLLSKPLPFDKFRQFLLRDRNDLKKQIAN